MKLIFIVARYESVELADRPDTPPLPGCREPRTPGKSIIRVEYTESYADRVERATIPDGVEVIEVEDSEVDVKAEVMSEGSDMMEMPPGDGKFELSSRKVSS